ncbi:MAG: glycoside hydrolase family 97 protein [Bacteroidales bacterium]|nr:glycoside hydrolase family 97 protein [Bacteroidales bacterium]
MRRFKIAIFCIIVVLVFNQSTIAQSYSVHSPDDRIEMHFELLNSRPYYCINKDGRNIIMTSSLGFISNGDVSLDSGFRIKSVEYFSNDTLWEPIWGETSSIREHYNAIIIHLKNRRDKIRIDIEIKAFNDGVGFRYIFPEQKRYHSFEIIEELTEFNFTENHSAWWIPDDYNSYEYLYQNTKLSEIKACNTPITLESDLGTCFSIHEANLTGFPDMTLTNTGNNRLKAKLVPSPYRYSAKITTPFSSPWRTIIIADSASELITSHVIENLNEPTKFIDTDWIKPMKYIGIWWGMHIGHNTWETGPTHGATTKNAKSYIDFAAKNNIDAVLFEGWNKGWETWHTDKNQQSYTEAAVDFDLEEVARYAKQQGVEIIGHHETGGNIPMYESQLDSAFRLYKSLGINAIKTGYAGNIFPKGFHKHGQMMVEHYRKVLETAAKYEIMIDAHEPIKATGIRRTYPNMMSREGARGMEWNAWSEGNPPEHTVVLPFTRCLAGPLDYTPGIFNLQFSGYRMGYRVHTTLSRQLALMITLYSPLQMAADIIENYQDHPAFQFIKDVAVSWDETKVINAKIGDYYTVARRNKDQWFLASTTDENYRHFNFPLNFLSEDQQYTAYIYSDAITTDWDKNPTGIDICEILVNSRDTLPVVLSNNGGMVIQFKPNENANYDNLDDLKNLVSHKLKAYSKIPIHGQLRTSEHPGMQGEIQLKYKPDGDFTAEGSPTLLDGVLGQEWDYTKHWLGFHGKNFEAVIDLGEKTEIHNIRTGFLRNQISWIFLPKNVIYETSMDGKIYEQVFIHDGQSEKDANGPMIKDVIASNINKQARYIKIKVNALKTCPEWHYGFGKSSWLFIDEIMINFDPNYFDNVEK